ncbi:MAG: right-handed parallel beta-helix repeat-containing protein, partial [Planctomycetota bacterium]
MSFANTSVLGKLRAVVASTVSMSAIALFAASMPAHADANCQAGANHLTSANTTTQFFNAFGLAFSEPDPGCALCGVLVTADASGMSQGQLNNLGANFAAVDTNGVFGTMTLSGTTVTATNLGQLLSRTCVSANVSVNATGWDQARIDVLAANITKIDSISGLPAGRTLTVSADGVSGATISGAGSVILNSTAVSGSAVLTGISSALTFPASLSIDAGGVLAAYPEQISGKTLVGAGTVSIVGTVGSNTDITTITAATSVDLDGTAGAAILTGSTLTLTAAQADGKTLSGAGTAAISGNIDANANFTAISSVLSIPGSVSSGATLTITAAQANGRTLGGLGAIYVPADDLTDNANFRGVTTTGFSFSGSIAAGKILSVNAVQTAGLTVAGAGSVDVLCTSANDTVSGNIDAAVIASGLAGSDSLSSGDGADTLSGGDDNDTLAAGAGNDAIDGGAGSDSAQFGSNLADASFSAYSSTFTVTSALDGADSVTGVETLVFADKTVYVVAADGAYASLNAALAAAPAGSSFYGAALGLDATTPGFTNTATLNAILARCVGGSTFSVNVLGMNAAQLAAVAANTATIGAVTYPPVEVVSAGAPSGYFTTIQAAINFATAGDIVNVAAGTYAENITIAKSLDVRGPNYAVSPNTGTRGAEAILVPSSTNTSTGAVVTITSSGVSFRGFTVDGDNTALPPSGTGLGGAYGLSVDAARCVFLQGNGLNGVTLSKNVAKNSVNGLRIEQTTNFFASGAVAVRSTNIVLDDNRVQDMTGTGIRLGNSMYAKVTNNTVANADNGIAFSSFRISDAGSAADRVISGNTISARYAGIWVNLFHASPYALVNNTITVAPAATSMAPTPQNRTAWYGIMYSTVSAPQNFTNQTNLPLVATPEWWTAT